MGSKELRGRRNTKDVSKIFASTQFIEIKRIDSIKLTFLIFHNNPYGLRRVGIS
uniref:Uncharacterized protein n=1 Tax=Solanum lycopersicum TaxID=4081 RepID=K4B5D9_SOLLC